MENEDRYRKTDALTVEIYVNIWGRSASHYLPDVQKVNVPLKSRI